MNDYMAFIFENPEYVAAFFGGASVTAATAIAGWRVISGTPEPGLIYHDRVSPADIRKFKKAERRYSPAEIIGVEEEESTFKRFGYAQKRIKVSFKDEMGGMSTAIFSGKNQLDLESKTEGVHLNPQNLIGCKVLLHQWGSELMAVSPINRK